MVWYWAADLVLPVLATVVGGIFRRHPPKYGKPGYKSRRAEQSAESWEYAQRRLGEMWLKVGIALIAAVIIHRVYSELDPVYVTAINVAAGIMCLLAAVPILEHELKEKFENRPPEPR